MRVNTFNQNGMPQTMEVVVNLTPSDVAVITRALAADSPNDGVVATANQELYDDFRRLQRDQKILDTPE